MYPYELEVPISIGWGQTSATSEVADPEHLGVTWFLTIVGNNQWEEVETQLKCPNRLGYSFVVDWSVMSTRSEVPQAMRQFQVTVAGGDEPIKGRYLVKPEDRSDPELRLRGIIVVNKGILSPKLSPAVTNGSFSVIQLFQNGSLQEDHFTDCKIHCQGVNFYAHRSVLAAKSPVLRTALTYAGSREATEMEVDISDFPPLVVQAFLVGLYEPKFLDVCAGELR